jgi:hypothetical protein
VDRDRAAYLRDWREKNREKLQAARRESYIKNRAQILADRRATYSSEKKRKNDLWRFYKMTPEDFDRMVVRQGGCCAGCNDVFDRNKPIQKSIHVDHCHKTGKVRGLLCPPCNLAVGHLKDSYERAEKIAEYLKNHG